jgi:hypothetical protein
VKIGTDVLGRYNPSYGIGAREAYGAGDMSIADDMADNGFIAIKGYKPIKQTPVVEAPPITRTTYSPMAEKDQAALVAASGMAKPSIQKAIGDLLDTVNNPVIPKNFNPIKVITSMNIALAKREEELASLVRAQRLLKKKGVDVADAAIKREADKISEEVTALRTFLEDDATITKLLSIKPPLGQPSTKGFDKARYLRGNKAAMDEEVATLTTQTAAAKEALKVARKFEGRLANVERTSQKRTYKDMFEQVGNAERIAKLEAQINKLGQSPEPVTPVDMRAILRADNLDEFADGLESMPSMIRREFALTDFGMPYINSLRMNTALERPSITIDFPKLERLLSVNFSELSGQVLTRGGKSLDKEIVSTIAKYQNSKELTEAIKKVWRESPEVGGGKGTNMFQLLQLVKRDLNLDSRLMYRLFDEIVVKDQKIARETRDAETAAKSLELSGYGRLGRQSASNPTSSVGQREYLDEATKAELGEYQNIAYSIEKNVAAVGRVVVERGVRNELRSIVDDAYGGVWNLGQRNLPEEIDSLHKAGNLVALEQGDAYEIFKRGDLVPPTIAREIQISNAAGDIGKNGIFNFLSQVRAIFSGSKLGTLGSLTRQVVGGFSLADAAGYSAIELGTGIAKYFSEVGKFKKTGERSAAYEELLSSGGLHTNFYKSEQAMTDSLLAEAAATGDRRMNGIVQGILNYKLEQTGAAKGVLSDRPNLQRIARLGGIEIGVGALAGAAAGTAVLPVVGTAVGAAVGAVAGATQGGMLGLNRKFFETFGEAEEMLRAGMYFAARERGESIAESAEIATEAMYNYQARPVLAAASERLGIPFQTFAAVSTTKVLEQLFTRPARLARATLLGEKAERGREDYQTAANERIAMPQWLKDSNPVPLPFKDSEGRGYYLPTAPLLSVQQLDTLLRGGDAKQQLQKTINGIPLAQLVYTIVANQKFNGAALYSKNADSVEISAKALGEFLNTMGYPTQAGSPLMENVAKQAMKFIETDESLAEKFGSDKDTVAAQMFRYSMAILENGYNTWGENSMPTQQDPNKAPSKDLAQLGSQIVGLTTQTVQGSASQLGDRVGKIKSVQTKIQALEQEYGKKLSSVGTPKDQQLLLEQFGKDRDKLIKELQLLTR